jgi:hypothetical protein
MQHPRTAAAESAFVSGAPETTEVDDWDEEAGLLPRHSSSGPSGGAGTGAGCAPTTPALPPVPLKGVASPATPAPESQLCDGSFRSVKDGKLFNALDTLLVKNNSVMMPLVDPVDVHNYKDAYLKSPAAQLRLLLWRSAVLLLRNKYFILAHIMQVVWALLLRVRGCGGIAGGSLPSCENRLQAVAPE